MKILQLITSLNTGGAEKLIVDAVPLYQGKGLEVDVLVLKDNDSPFRTALATKSKGKIWTLTKGSVYNPLLIFKIIPFLKKYDRIHVHLFPALYWAVLAKWISFSKVKIIYTEHNTDNRRMKFFLFRWADRLIYRGISKIVTISDAVDASIKKHLQFSEDKFTLIPNGVDISLYAEARPYPKTDFFDDKDFLLIQVSSFREQKDQATLLRAMALLPDEVKLLLVGEGPLKKENENLAQELKIAYRVKFLGVRTDVPQLLQTADVAILSSHYEGFGLVAIEGMSCHKPFVASDVPGLGDITRDAGLVFPQGDAQALANCISKLQQDSIAYHAIANQCLKRAKEFDIHTMVERYISLFTS